MEKLEIKDKAINWSLNSVVEMLHYKSWGGFTISSSAE